MNNNHVKRAHTPRRLLLSPFEFERVGEGPLTERWSGVPAYTYGLNLYYVREQRPRPATAQPNTACLLIDGTPLDETSRNLLSRNHTNFLTVLLCREIDDSGFLIPESDEIEDWDRTLDAYGLPSECQSLKAERFFENSIKQQKRALRDLGGGSLKAQTEAQRVLESLRTLRPSHFRRMIAHRAGLVFGRDPQDPAIHAISRSLAKQGGWNEWRRNPECGELLETLRAEARVRQRYTILTSLAARWAGFRDARRDRPFILTVADSRGREFVFRYPKKRGGRHRVENPQRLLLTELSYLIYYEAEPSEDWLAVAVYLLQDHLSSPSSLSGRRLSVAEVARLLNLSASTVKRRLREARDPVFCANLRSCREAWLRRNASDSAA